MGLERKRVIERLTIFSRNEHAAAEGCRVARKGPAVRAGHAELRRCEDSHHARAVVLDERVVRMGGPAPVSAKLRQALATTLEQTMRALSGRSTLALLEASEDERLEDYQTNTEDLDDETRRFITEDLLPKQELTHRVICTLKYACG